MTLKQGDIIKFNFDPALGHEQAGYRPAVVISREMFNSRTRHAVVCPVTQTNRAYPTRVSLGTAGEIKGYVMCDQIKTIDITARKPVFIERADENILDKILVIVDSIIQKDF